jgi:hypothetical protein
MKHVRRRVDKEANNDLAHKISSSLPKTEQPTRTHMYVHTYLRNRYAHDIQTLGTAVYTVI